MGRRDAINRLIDSELDGKGTLQNIASRIFILVQIKRLLK